MVTGSEAILGGSRAGVGGHQSQRFGLTMISAISSKGLVRFEFLEGAATTEATLGFMQRLVQDNEGHKVFLILDNLRAHYAKEVAPSG